MKARAVSLVAIALLATGAVAAAWAARDLAQRRARVALRARDWAQLVAVQADLAGYEQALARIAKAGWAPAVPLADLLREALPDVAPDETRDASTAAVPGWRVRRQELTFRQAPLDRVMAFARRAESPGAGGDGRPRLPWRLARCTLRAAPGNPGSGQVVLVLETVERAEEVDHGGSGSHPAAVLGAGIPGSASGSVQAPVRP